jgi:hypothetical protein
MAIEVTVRDTESGESETTIVTDYVIVCTHPCHVASTQAYGNGTHVLTVKGAHRPPLASVHITHEPPRETSHA